MPDKHLLIVEDETKLASLLVDYFEQEQFHCSCLYDGAQVIEFLQHHSPDIMLLDVMLPGKDGLQLCREIRQFSSVPILMLTARVEEVDRLLGLELGADDYICKPFSPKEVVARVKAVLRRVQPAPKPDSGLTLDESRYQVSFNGQVLPLTSVEFQLLKPLVNDPERIFSREQLMRNMYQDNRIVSERTIDSHIKKLRKKLQQLTPDKELIQSVYGVGYRLVP